MVVCIRITDTVKWKQEKIFKNSLKYFSSMSWQIVIASTKLESIANLSEEEMVDRR